jgi:DNA-binding LacI/PurR family transcriptional regulator
VLGSDDQAGWLGAFGHLPVARIGHGSPAEQSVRVTVDEDDAARQLLAHLAHGTPQRFVFLGEHLTAHVLRFQALEKRVSGASPILSARYSMASGFEAGLQAAKQLLAEPLEYDAFICATDLIAMGALRALHDTGRHMAVTGFDDIPAAAQFIPPLTTIRQPLEDMAERAIAAVIESAAPSEIVLPGNLIIRSTS